MLLSELQAPLHFLESFKSAIDSATTRIWIQAMVVETGGVVDQIEPLLIAAVGRGVDVRVYFDWVTHEYFHGEIRFLPSINAFQNQIEADFHAENRAFFERLKKSGVHVIEMNRPRLGRQVLPVMGRNHIKIYMADGVAWMGGMNFFDTNFKELDFLVRFEASVMVEALSKQIEMVNELRPKQDFAWDVGELGTLVVDSGKRMSSLIYANALEVVAGAKREIVFASQLVPENRMLDLLLNKAHEGVQITVYTSDVADKNFNRYPFKYFYDTFRKKIELGGGAITFVHLHKKIHAKVVWVDGREVMFGSHNFVESGIRMGTQEISLRSHNASLVEQVGQFISSLQNFTG